MPHPLHNWRHYRGWLVGITVFLIGIILILSDRIAAHANPDHPWIAHPKESFSTPDPQPGEPWPASISQIVFSQVEFQYESYDNIGSRLDEIFHWIEGQAQIKIDVDWHALAAADLKPGSTIRYSATSSSLPNLLEAILEKMTEKSSFKPKLFWEAHPDRIISITTASEHELEQACKIQRQKTASPQLRKSLDRKIPYVKLRELTLEEALLYCQRVSGVKIRLQNHYLNNTAQIDVIARDITFEELIEQLIRHTSGNPEVMWHFKVEGEGLRVFRDRGDE